VNNLSFGERLSNFLKHEIDSINDHLPKTRVSLVNALEGYSFYVSRKNERFYIDQNEVKQLHKLCPEDKRKNVYLPMIVIRRRDFGKGVYVISGELIEEFLILKAIGKYKKSWREFLKDPPPQTMRYLNKQDIIVLRKVLSTSTIIGFS